MLLASLSEGSEAVGAGRTASCNLQVVVPRLTVCLWKMKCAAISYCAEEKMFHIFM